MSTSKSGPFSGTHVPSLEIAQEVHRIRRLIDSCHDDPVFADGPPLLVELPACDCAIGGIIVVFSE